MRNNNQKEYIDIPLAIESTPLHLYEKLADFKLPAETIEIGFDLITRIDNAIRSPDSTAELLSIYINYFEPTNASKFVDCDWPACHEIQAAYEDKDFSAKVQTLYNELRLRNKFNRLKHEDTDAFLGIAEEAWETYESILQRESKEVNFPPIIAWELLQNFLYELGKYHQIRLTLKDQSDVQEFVFNVVKSKKLLQNLINNIPAEQTKAPSSRQNFSYFALVVKATLEVYEGNYRQALNILSRVSLTNLSVYSRSIGALLNLFLTASFAYFMLEQYKQSARLAQMLLMFFQKNKKYFTGVNGEHIINRQFEKLAGLLCLNYIFLQEKPKNVIMQIFKVTTIRVKDKAIRQKISDKYTKLRQNDIPTFTKLFQYVALPSISNNGQQIHDLVLARFKHLQTITLNTILQHYKQISITKIAAMLKVTEDEVLTRIESFNNISTGNAAWDRTIMQPLLNQTRKIYVQVIDGVVKLDTDETNANQGFNEWQQYKKEISWLVEKVNSL